MAPYGFGAEVRRALEQRREALRRLGVEPDDPDRAARLRELQRQSVGRDIAVRSGLPFVRDIPEGFRGHVQPAGASFPESKYAVVSDGSRFVLMRASPSLRTAQGKVAALQRDARGQVTVHQLRGKDISPY